MKEKVLNPLTVKVSFMAAIGLVLSVGAGFLLIHIANSASRTIGWVFFSISIAFLLYPGVNKLDKYMNRTLSVLVMVILTLLIIVVPIYSVVRDVNLQTDKLEKSLPARAHELEEKGRFASSFKQFKLEKKTRSTIEALPNFIKGGSKKDQLQANANRGIAFIASAVMMLFFLGYGKRLIDGMIGAIPEKKKQDEIKAKLSNAYQRATTFAWAQIGLSISTGLFAYAICRAYSIPASGLLATWVAFWNIIPIFGTVFGSLPILILAGAKNINEAFFILALFIVYEIIESYFRRRYLAHRSMRIDAVIQIFVFFAGLELYGLGGALTGLLIVAFFHALASEYSDISVTKKTKLATS